MKTKLLSKVLRPTKSEKKKISIVTFILLSVLSISGQTIPPSLANKYVFKGQYPLTSTFRGNHNQVTSYTDFVNQLTKAGSHIPDLIDINLFYDTTNVIFANQMAQAYPNNLFLQLKQANGGIPRYYQPWPNSIDRICGLPITFPGHWVVKPPTTLVGNINSTATVIQVASAIGFTIGNYMPNFPNGCPAILVETDLAGNKVWGHYEYVYITAITGNTFTVTRAYRDSPASSVFTGGRTIVAPLLVNYTWNIPLVWYTNFSPSCPLDTNGKTASQVLIDDLQTRFGPSSTLSNFSGIAYASGPFTDAPTGVDYNWDGTVDSTTNYYTGVNSYLSSIRQQIDTNFILLSGNNNINYVDNFNGLNNEGLVQPDDPWRRITNALNDDNYWTDYSHSPRLTEETLRIQDDSAAGILNSSKWVQLVRLGNGYATCHGACADIKDKIFTNPTPADSSVIALTWVELFKGTDNQEHWLGHSVSPPIYVASKTPSILGDSATDWTNIIPHLSFQNGTMSVSGNELVLTPNSNQNHSLTMSLNLSQTKNLTVLFDVISNGSQLVHTIKSPSISVSSLTVADAATYYTNANYLTREYYWRHLDPTATSCTVSFNFTGSNVVRFRSMSVHQAPDCLARLFENGVVLVNPSLEDITFNLTALFGTGLNYSRLTAPNLTVSPQWQSQYQQTIDMNNGAVITDPTQVIVPALNSLFLKSQSIATGLNEKSNRNYVTINPNPSTGIFTVISSDKIKEIEVFNVFGEVIYSKQNTADNTTYKLDFSSFSKGIYFVKITNANKNINTQKIIIQ